MSDQSEEITMQEARAILGLSLPMARQVIQAAGLASRLVLGNDGRARRLMKRSDVVALLKRREDEASEQTGKGRPIKLPRKSEATTWPATTST